MANSIFRESPNCRCPDKTSCPAISEVYSISACLMQGGGSTVVADGTELEAGKIRGKPRLSGNIEHEHVVIASPSWVRRRAKTVHTIAASNKRLKISSQYTCERLSGRARERLLL